MELHEIQRYIYDENAAGRPVKSIAMSKQTHDAIRSELRGLAFGADCDIEGVTLKQLFGLPVQIED